MCIYATGFILVYSFCSYLISSRFVESTKMLCGDFSWKVMPRIDIPSGSHTPKAPKDTELGDAQSEHTELLGWALNKAEDLFPHCLDGPCINDMYINRWHISIYPYIFVFSPWSFVPVEKFCECRKLHEFPINSHWPIGATSCLDDFGKRLTEESTNINDGNVVHPSINHSIHQY